MKYSEMLNDWREKINAGKEKIKTRDKFNRLIFHTVQFMEIENEYPGTQESIENQIDRFKDFRFGQVICNDICPDYRDETRTEKTLFIMSRLFSDLDMDPFYEEPCDTYNRLCKSAEKL